MSEFGVLLTAYRRRADLSMYQLGRAAHIDSSYVSHLESGSREPPRPAVLRHLMDALGLTREEQQHFVLVATGLVGATEAADAILHGVTMRAANALIAACPCGPCAAQRAALEQAG